jgi:hypothetical protein
MWIFVVTPIPISILEFDAEVIFNANPNRRAVFGPYAPTKDHMSEPSTETRSEEAFFTPISFERACRVLIPTYRRSGIEARWTPLKAATRVSHGA